VTRTRSATSDAQVIVDPEDELAGHGMLMQSDSNGPVQLCVSGPLCVEQRDLPEEQDVRAAQEAVGAELRELGIVSSGAGGSTVVLEGQALLGDRATVDRVYELVAPWLTSEQVVVDSAVLPLAG